MVATHHTRMSSKGQVVIPKEVRDRLRLREGDELSVEQTDDGIILRVQRSASDGLFGPTLSADEVLSRLSGTYRGPAVSEAEAARRLQAGLRARWKPRSTPRAARREGPR